MLHGYSAGTEETQIRSVEDALLRKYEGRVPQARIHAEFKGSLATFADARIRIYLPTLIQRQVIDRLDRLPQAKHA